MDLLRRIAAPLLSTATYARWAHLVLGGVVLLPYLVAAAVLVSLVLTGGTALLDAQEAAAPSLVGGVPLALAGVVATAWIPGVRTMEGHLARALLGGPMADHRAGEPATWRTRMRTGLWLAAHLTVGFAVCLGTMVGLTEAAGLALAPLAARPEQVMPMAVWLLGGPPVHGLRLLAAPLVGALLLAGVVYAVALVGAGMARLAPVLLGPSPAERLAAAQERVEALAERNRLARELHDSIGHALSVVALQAGAAARVIDADPAFARSALEAIADQARTATADLDHVLGLLREERAGTAPQRDLGDLEGLLAATRATGARLEASVEGEVARVPGVVSREAFRVCQEALTNALRHGGVGGPIILRLRVAPGALEAEVANPAPPRARAPRRGGGRGLRGARERLRLLGGTLAAGPEPDGHWRLRAAVTWKDTA
ncbi:histidine kinase [Streptomonospora sp. S1-112]|uniref:histidine kinase n=1 Tax=Streptomonospora mangrovi TaxID=2883123 RepID=A0A9X3SE71_9ACTN|nr:histidine kinase [Streptomonospora mangrovi]MDA0563430.1 histidine kinase [Streptomonospora mangrovi]